MVNAPRAFVTIAPLLASSLKMAIMAKLVIDRAPPEVDGAHLGWMLGMV